MSASTIGGAIRRNPAPIFPGAFIVVLGVSIHSVFGSFSSQPEIVLNSVFLHECCSAGLDLRRQSARQDFCSGQNQ